LQLLDSIKNSKYILIISNNEIKTLSFCLALSNYFFENKIKHRLFIPSKQLPRQLEFLNKFDKITTVLPKFYDLIIYFDNKDTNIFLQKLNSDIKMVNLDIMGKNNIYQFFIKNNIYISQQIASCLFVGFYSDDLDNFDILNSLKKLGANPKAILKSLKQNDTLAKYRLLPKVLNSLKLHNEGQIATIYLKHKWLKQTGASDDECDCAMGMILDIKIVKKVIFFKYLDGKTKISLRIK
jgi:phosphoesterase RecJ-like protein